MAHWSLHRYQALHPIAKGAEIFIQYNTGEYTYEERQRETQILWSFACRCKLCEVEGSESPKMRGHRQKLAEQIENSLEKHITGTQIEPPPAAVVKEAERLEREMIATYNEHYSGIPKLPLARIQGWMIEAYGKRRAKIYAVATTVLKTLAYDVVEKPQLDVRTTSTTAVAMEAMTAFTMLAAMKYQDGERGVAMKLEAMAKQVARVHTGQDVENFLPKMLDV